jgi:hypothetical protein
LIPFSNLLGTLAWAWDRECFRGRLHRKILVTLPKPFSFRLISLHHPPRLRLLPSRLPPCDLKQWFLQAPQNSIHYQTIASTHLVCLQRRASLIAVPTLQAPPEKLRQWLDPQRQWALQAMHISNLVSMAVYFPDSPFWMIFLGPMTILPLRRLFIERQIQPEMLSFVQTEEVVALFNMCVTYQ